MAVISYGYWQRRFGRDRAVLGQTFTWKGTVFRIIRVTPPEFSGELVEEVPDIWTPLTAQPLAPEWLWNTHSTTWLRIVGRLRPGVTRVQAQAAVVPVFERMQNEIALGMKKAQLRKQFLESRLALEDGSTGVSRLRDRFSLPLQLLMAVVGLFLLIACANVANLLLARSAARRREIAVRLAIGAGRARLIRQLLAESAILCVLGGFLGLLLAQGGSRFLVSSVNVVLASRGLAPVSVNLRPDTYVLMFTVALSVVTGILFGLAPALRATRFELTPALKDAAGSARAVSHFRLAKTLVVSQLALSLFLLLGADLFIRSLQSLNRIETGFDPGQVLLFRIGPEATLYTQTQLAQLYRRLLERAEAVPGVRAASLSFFGLFTGATWGNTLTIEGYTARPDEVVHSLANAISPRYFEVMGIRLLRGRHLTWRDHDKAARVALVNQTFARRYFGNADPIGQRFGLGPAPKEMIEIVGVVEDAKYVDLRESHRPMLYVPFLQYPAKLNELEVRTAGNPTALPGILRRELAAVDRSLPVLKVTSMRERVDASIAGERLIATLSGVFGALALLLASVGLYGVMAYAVARRTSEIGIRMALGARPGDVLRLVLHETLLLIVISIAFALPAALACGRLISSQLYGVSPNDPLTITVATLVLCAVGLVAAYAPARRATLRIRRGPTRIRHRAG